MQYRTPSGCKADPEHSSVDDLGDVAASVDYALKWTAEDDPNIEIQGDAECELDERDDTRAWVTVPEIRIHVDRNQRFPDIAARIALGELSTLTTVAHSCADAAEERRLREQRQAEASFAARERAAVNQGKGE
jgi:hypothetical protein